MVVLEIVGASGLRFFRIIEDWNDPLLVKSLREWSGMNARFLIHYAIVY